MAVKLADAFIQLTARVDTLERDLSDARRKTNVFADAVQGIFQGIGQQITRSVAGAIQSVVGSVSEGIQSFVSFENEMNKVFTLLPGISGQAMGQLTGQVKDFAKEFGILPQQVVPALYQALSSGVPSNNVFEFLATAQKTAVGGVTDLTTSVDVLTSVINAYGADTLSAAEASDIMFQTVGIGKAEIDQLARSLYEVIPTASGLGVEFANVGAALAVMTAQGTPAGVATSQLRQLLIELSKEGAAAADVFERAAGQSFVDFIASGRNVQDALVVMERTAAANGLRLSDMFSSVEAGNAALQLTGRGAEEFTTALQAMEDATGSTDAAFETMESGIGATLRRIRAGFGTFSLDIGTALAPVVTVFADTFEGLMPQMTEWGRQLIQAFTDGLGDFIYLITPWVVEMRALFSYWLQANSPPRLLPEITNWGRSTIQAYLDGFKGANVKAALDNVGKGIESVLRSFAATGRIQETDIFARVFGSRQAIEKAVREFRSIGRVTSETMAEIIRQAGPAGSSIAGLVRAYFDLQKASKGVADAQENLTRVTEHYDKILNPLKQRLAGVQGQQQAIRDEQRIASLRDDIADADLAQVRAQEAAAEIEAIRLKQRTATNQTWFEQVQDAERIAELERVIADASGKRGAAELARLEIQELQLSQQIDSQEDLRNAAIRVEEERLAAAEAVQAQAQAALDNEQALLDLQLERNRLVAEEMRLQAELEAQRLAAIQKLADEQRKAAEEAQREIERQQRDEAAVRSAKFEYEFSIADTPQQLELLEQKLAETDEGTVDYFRTLQRLSALQEQYARELSEVPYDEAAEEAKRIAAAQFAYQLSIADTAGKLELLNDRLDGTTEGSVEYYQLLTQISALQAQYAREQEAAANATDDETRAAEAAADAQFDYQLAISDTAGKIALLTERLGDVEEGSAEYYQIQTQLFRLQEQLTREQERAAQALDESSLAAQQAADAQFQYQLAISDTAEKIALLTERLAGTEQGSVEYFQILTQLAGLQERYNQEIQDTSGTDAAAEAQFAYQLAIADTAGKIELLTQKLAGTEEGSAEYYRILTQLAGLQEQYNRELENTSGTDAATEAQFAYQFSIADTAGKLELLRAKLAETDAGTAEYYQTLTQIAALEQQYQAQIENATDAQFQYQLAIAGTPEKIALLQQALAGTTEGSAEYYRILGQISQLEDQYQGQLESDARKKTAEAEREQEKALREHEAALKAATIETDRIEEAQFRYQLALADTAGKIELYKQKLAEAQPGSAEYFDLLTKLHGLEQQHNSELKLSADNLTTLGETDITTGLETGVNKPLEEAKTDAGKLSEAMTLLVEELNKPPQELPQNMKDAVDNFNRLTEEIGLTIGAIGGLLGIDYGPFAEANRSGAQTASEAWMSYGYETEAASSRAGEAAEAHKNDLGRIFGQLAENFEIVRLAINGDWAEMWELLKEQTARDNPQLIEKWGWLWTQMQTIFGDFVPRVQEEWRGFMGWLANVGEFLQPIYDGGAQFVGNLLAGLQSAWWQVQDWWRTSLQWIRDQLPFSEPADVSSPLRGLGEAGAALLGSFLSGLQSAWGSVQEWWEGKLQWMKDQLPGSEPKDISSPLRGLTKTGKALVEMVQLGIDQASFDLNPLADRLLVQPSSLPAMPTAAGNNLVFDIDVVIEGNADEENVRQGVFNGVTQALRLNGVGV